MTTVEGHPKSQQYGGTGGKPFQDDLTEAKELIAIAIRHGDRIDRRDVSVCVCVSPELKSDCH